MPSFIRAFGALFFVALLSACATPPANTLRVTNDHGGLYMERMREIAMLQKERTDIRIQGKCQSACTLYLKLEDQTCVTPTARLGFHGPQIYKDGRLFNVPEPERSQALVHISANYPDAIRGWFLQNAAHLSGPELAWMSGKDAVALGVRPCT